MAKSKSPAFQFYPDSWLSSTNISLMTPAEEGAYIRLLCHAWMAPDCGLPDDDAALAELSRLRSQWPKSAARIRARFTTVGGRLFNDRLIEEREKQKEWSRKSSFGGKKSATKRQAKGNHPSTTLQPPLQNGCGLVGETEQPTGQPNPNISSSSSSSTPSLTKTVSEGGRLAPIVPIKGIPDPGCPDYGVRYAALYAAYPVPGYQREGLHEFFEAIKDAASPDAVADSMDSALMTWKAHWASHPGEYVPGIEKWIKERWYLKQPKAREPTQKRDRTMELLLAEEERERTRNRNAESH